MPPSPEPAILSPAFDEPASRSAEPDAGPAEPVRRGPLARLGKRTGWALLAGAGLLAGAWWWFGGNAAPAVRPLLAKVDFGDVENVVTAAGALQPSRFVDVGAQVSGQLQKLHVDVGQEVSQGDLVAEIDATVQINRVEASRASLKAMEAQLSAKQANLELAQANADRQARLMSEDATSQADFDSAMTSLASAQSSLVQLQSQIAQSRASLASDEATLAYSRIEAPIDGTVVDIRMKEGQTLNASQQTPVIMRIADLKTKTVEAEVSEADVAKLKPGMEAYFTTLGSGERRWHGKLRQVLPTPEVANNVVLYTALFDVDNRDGTLLPNMTAQVFFVTSSARNVLKVPLGALTFGNGSGRSAAAAQSFAERASAMGMGAFSGFGGMGGGGAAAGSGFPQDGMGRPDFAMGAGMAPRPRGGRGVQAQVQLVREDGSIETRDIRIGVTSRIAAEVLSGLEAGDQVVAGIVQTDSRESSRPPDRPFAFR